MSSIHNSKFGEYVGCFFFSTDLKIKDSTVVALFWLKPENSYYLQINVFSAFWSDFEIKDTTDVARC